MTDCEVTAAAPKAKSKTVSPTSAAAVMEVLLSGFRLIYKASIGVLQGFYERYYRGH